MWEFQITIDTGNYYEEFTYQSDHRANSKANLQDALKEWNRRHEKMLRRYDTDCLKWCRNITNE